MAREVSIPTSLVDPIIRRWIAGMSAQAIFEWIEETNERRATPVQTSRASVQRLIRRVGTDGRYAQLAAVRRARHQAPEHVEIMHEIEQRLFALSEIEATPEICRPERRVQFSQSLRALNQASIVAMRCLRVAGALGREAERVLEANAPMLAEIERSVRAEDRAAGLPTLSEEYVQRITPAASPVATTKPEPARLDAAEPLNSSRKEASRIPVSPIPKRPREDSGTLRPAA